MKERSFEDDGFDIEHINFLRQFTDRIGNDELAQLQNMARFEILKNYAQVALLPMPIQKEKQESGEFQFKVDSLVLIVDAIKETLKAREASNK